MNRILVLVLSAILCWGGAVACSGGGSPAPQTTETSNPGISGTTPVDIKPPNVDVDAQAILDAKAAEEKAAAEAKAAADRAAADKLAADKVAAEAKAAADKAAADKLAADKAAADAKAAADKAVADAKVAADKAAAAAKAAADKAAEEKALADKAAAEAKAAADKAAADKLAADKAAAEAKTAADKAAAAAKAAAQLTLMLKLQGFSMADPYYYTGISGERVFTKIAFTTGDGYLSFDVKETTGSDLKLMQLKLTDPDGDTVFDVIPTLDKYISFIPQMAGVYTVSFTAEAAETIKTEIYKFQILDKPIEKPTALIPSATLSGVTEGQEFPSGSLKFGATGSTNVVSYAWTLVGPNLNVEGVVPDGAAFTKIYDGYIKKECGGCSDFEVVLPAPIPPMASSQYVLTLMLTSSTGDTVTKNVKFTIKMPLTPSADLQGFPVNGGHYSSDNKFTLTAVNAKNVAKYGWKLSGPNLKTATVGTDVVASTLLDSTTILTKECSDCVSFSFGSPVIAPLKSEEYKVELLLTSSTGDQVSKEIVFYIEGPPAPKVPLIPAAVITGIVDKQIVAAGSYTVKAENSTNVSQYAWKLKGPKGEQTGDGATFTFDLPEPNAAGSADSFALTLTLTSITGDIATQALTFQVAAKPAPALYLGGAPIQNTINVIADHPLYASKPYSLDTTKTTGVGLSKVTLTITNPLSKVVLTQTGNAGGTYTYNFPLSGDYTLHVDAEGIGGSSSVEYILTISDEP